MVAETGEEARSLMAKFLFEALDLRRSKVRPARSRPWLSKWLLQSLLGSIPLSSRPLEFARISDCISLGYRWHMSGTPCPVNSKL